MVLFIGILLCVRKDTNVSQELKQLVQLESISPLLVKIIVWIVLKASIAQILELTHQLFVEEVNIVLKECRLKLIALKVLLIRVKGCGNWVNAWSVKEENIVSQVLIRQLLVMPATIVRYLRQVHRKIYVQLGLIVQQGVTTPYHVRLESIVQLRGWVLQLRIVTLVITAFLVLKLEIQQTFQLRVEHSVQQVHIV